MTYIFELITFQKIGVARLLVVTDHETFMPLAKYQVSRVYSSCDIAIQILELVTSVKVAWAGNLIGLGRLIDLDTLMPYAKL